VGAGSSGKRVGCRMKYDLPVAQSTRHRDYRYMREQVQTRGYYSSPRVAALFRATGPNGQTRRRGEEYDWAPGGRQEGEKPTSDADRKKHSG
jgi:hypothetical protein